VGAGSAQVGIEVGTEVGSEVGFGVGINAGLDPLEWSFGLVICGSR
jgi:hypothetical protein